MDKNENVVRIHLRYDVSIIVSHETCKICTYYPGIKLVCPWVIKRRNWSSPQMQNRVVDRKGTPVKCTKIKKGCAKPFLVGGGGHTICKSILLSSSSCLF